MNTSLVGAAKHIHRRAGLESRWQEWISQPIAKIGTERPSYEAIARLAYALWERRGSPWGDPEQDWYRAERELIEHQHIGKP